MKTLWINGGILCVLSLALWLRPRAPMPSAAPAPSTISVSVTAPSAAPSGAITPSAPAATHAAAAASLTAARSPGSILPTFDNWLQRYLGESNVTARAALVAEGLPLAQARRQAFKQLIQQDPARALAAALPFHQRVQLPALIAAELETWVSGRAPLTVVYAKPQNGDPCPARTTIRFSRLNGSFYYLYSAKPHLFAVSRPHAVLLGVAVDDQMALAEHPWRLLDTEEAAELSERPDSSQTCPACGRHYASDGALAVLDVGGATVALCDETEVPAYFQTPDGRWIWASGGTGGTGVPSPVDPPTSTQGNLRFLFIRVRFADEAATSEPSTDARVRSDLDAVMKSYAAMSYGTLQGSYAFSPTVTLPNPRAGYLNGWSDVDGMSALLNDAKAAAAAIVENGLHPYDAANFDDVAARWNGEPGGCCSYGGGGNAWIRWDGPDVLVHEWGHAIGLGHANFWKPTTDDPIGPGTHEEYGNHLDAMGSGGSRHFSAMFKAQLNWLPPANYWAVTNSGTFRIFAHDQPQLVAGNRYGARVERLGRDGFKYWLEYRTSTLSGAEALRWTNGLVLLRDRQGQLLDTTPGTTSGKNDGPLTVGRTYQDLGAGLAITVVSRGIKGQPYLDVAVHFEDAVERPDPVSLITAATLTPTVGANVKLTCVAADLDAPALSYAWDFGDGTISLDGQPAQTKAWAAAGQYVVCCTVSDRLGHVSINSLSIKVGSAAEYSISGRVLTASGQPVAQVLISDGTGRQAWSGSDGSYTLGRLPAGTYTLTARKDRTPLQPPFVVATVPNNVVGADFQGELTRSPGHGVLREHWFNLAGTGVNNLTNSARFPNAPDGVQLVADAFEGPVDWAESYGARYRGYFRPPQSGFYTFWITSDDTSELWLSPSEDPARAQKICWLLSWASERNWSKSTNQQSGLFLLTAGDRYYLEARHKEGGGGDHLAVGIDFPDGTSQRPVDMRWLEPFGFGTHRPSAEVSVVARPERLREGGAAGSLVFTRTGPVDGPLDVQWSLSGSATYGQDYDATGLRATIPAGSSTLEVALRPLPDAIAETAETIIATVVSGPGYLAATNGTATVTLDDGGAVANVSLIALNVLASRAGPQPGRVSVRRTGPTSNDLLVNLSLAGSAVSGVDYQPLPAQITIPAGAASTDLEIVPLPASGVTAPRTVLLGVTTGVGYIAVAPIVATLTISQPGPGFGLLREYWNDLSAGTVRALTNDARFPATPTGREYLTTLLEGPRNNGDNYGARYTGWFVAPTTGNYFFSISSDDGSELWLGTNHLASSKRRIAYVSNYTGFRTWTTESNQRSGPQAMVAGQRYYIEALHAEGGGDDHLSVGVQMPGGVIEMPMTVRWLEPYTSGQPLVYADAPAPSALERGSDGRLRFRRTGDLSRALTATVKITGTAPLSAGYTMDALSKQPIWVRAERVGTVLNGYASWDGITWVQTGSQTNASLPASLAVRIFSAGQDDADHRTTIFDQVSVLPDTGSWSVSNVGVGDVGTVTAIGDSIRMTNSKPSALGNLTAYCSYFRTVTGNVSITARVAAFTSRDQAALAGVMLGDQFLVAAGSETIVACGPRSAAFSYYHAPLVYFPIGQDTVEFAITPRPHDVPFPGASVTATLQPGNGYQLGWSDAATVMIAPNRYSAGFSVQRAAQEALREPAELRVAMSGKPFGVLPIYFEIAPGSAARGDFVDPGPRLVVPLSSSSAAVSLQPVPDRFMEGPETVRIRMVSAGGYYALDTNWHDIPILDSWSFPLPPGYTNRDVGLTVLGSGLAQLANGFTLQAAGLGCTDAGDSFQFVSHDLGLHGILDARLAEHRSTDPQGLAGLMARVSMDPDAPFLFIGRRGDQRLVLLQRLNPGTAPQVQSFESPSIPLQLRLARQGSSLSAWQRLEGQAWQKVGEMALGDFPPEAQVGLLLSSGTTAQLAEADFTDLAFHHPFTLAPVPDQKAGSGETIGPLPLTVLSQGPFPDNLRFEVKATGTTLLEPDGIHVEGAGTNQTLRLVPARSESGRGRMAVMADDGYYQAHFSFNAEWGSVTVVEIRPTAGGELELTWPEALGSASVWAASSLEIPISWQRVAGTPILAGGFWHHPVPKLEQARFYRISTP